MYHKGYAEQIWHVVGAFQGRPFKSADIAKALPDMPRMVIRREVFHFVRSGRLSATQDRNGYIYREVFKPGEEPRENVELTPGVHAASIWNRICRMPKAEPEPDEEEPRFIPVAGLMLRA